MKDKKTISSTSLLVLIIIAFLFFRNNGNISSQNDYESTDYSTFQKAKVIRTVDGDTGVFEINGKKQKVRFTGINTPEYNLSEDIIEHYGKEAADYSKEILEDKIVYLEKDISDRDKYDRLLRYVWLDLPSDPDNPSIDDLANKQLNGKLVKEGYAYAGNYKPDVKYKKVFDQFQKEAKDKKIGMWSN